MKNPARFPVNDKDSCKRLNLQENISIRNKT